VMPGAIGAKTKGAAINTAKTCDQIDAFRFMWLGVRILFRE